MEQTNSSIGELVRKAEQDYTRGNTTISKYVQFQMHDTIEKIEAYLNSQFTTGSKDSLGRDKPFFNIVVASANIWQRATDIDRKDIKIRAGKSKDVIGAFVATVHLQQWMRKNNFGMFLNEWGRVLARYGSAVVEFVKKDGDLLISVLPWNRLIVDSVDFDNNPKIKILELTEAQLRENENYDQDAVDGLINAKKTRETIDKKQKDTKSDYYRLYEIHGKLSQATYKKAKGQETKEGDSKIFFDQMHVLSYVGNKKNKDKQDFLLYSGKEENPYMITHLIPEDGRTLAIGAVEHLFEAQWMQNHIAKNIKDQLDLASKLIFQTSDSNYIGRNVLTSIENGQIMIHAQNQPLTQINNASHDISAQQSFSQQWKMLGNEITGISEAMLGAMPKSGTAWRQTEAALQESHSLFENMTETKGLYLERMLREHIIPNLKTKMNTSEEIAATLESNDIEFIDSIYIPNQAIKNYNKKFADDVLNNDQKGILNGEIQPFPMMKDMEEANVRQSLAPIGNQRFFKPDEIKDTTWKKALKDLEWNVELDITGESKDVQEALSTLNSALKLVVTPGFEQNQKAMGIVGKMLELTSVMSSAEWSSLMSKPSPQPVQKTASLGTGSVAAPQLQVTQ